MPNNDWDILQNLARCFIDLGNGTFSLRVTNSLSAVSLISDIAYNILSSDEIIEFSSLTAARIVTLPTAVGVTGKRYIIKDGTGNCDGVKTITIATTSSQNIDGSTTFVMRNAYEVTRVYSNGSKWSTW